VTLLEYPLTFYFPRVFKRGASPSYSLKGGGREKINIVTLLDLSRISEVKLNACGPLAQLVRAQS
jgi:hypothetical protein